MGYQQIEAEFPGLRKYLVFSSMWYAAWKGFLLRKHPNADKRTRDNLDMFIAMAKQRERNKE